MVISLFSWNGKWLVKFEQGLCEQTYKFEHLEIDETDLRTKIDETFIADVLRGFESMHQTTRRVLS